MTAENLLFLLVIVFVAFSSVILPWLRKRVEANMPTAPEAKTSPVWGLPQVPRPRPVPVSSSYREGPIGARLPVATPPAATRRRARSPVTSLRDARRGIVLMTVLGPCHALKPSGSEQQYSG